MIDVAKHLITFPIFGNFSMQAESNKIYEVDYWIYSLLTRHQNKRSNTEYFVHTQHQESINLNMKNVSDIYNI